MTKSIICKDVFGNQYTVPVDELNIRVGVYAVIIEDNKILLTRQWDGYSLIGGGVEKVKRSRNQLSVKLRRKLD